MWRAFRHSGRTYAPVHPVDVVRGLPAPPLTHSVTSLHGSARLRGISNAYPTSANGAPLLLLVCIGILVLMGILPSGIIFWFCFGVLVMSCLRAPAHYHYIQMQHDIEAMSSQQVSSLARRAALMRLVQSEPWVILAQQQTPAPSNLHLLNLHLSMLNRDLTPADYELLAALDQAGSTGPSTAGPARPVSEAQLAALPVHRYKPLTASATASVTGSATCAASEGAGSTEGTQQGGWQGTRQAAVPVSPTAAAAAPGRASEGVQGQGGGVGWQASTLGPNMKAEHGSSSSGGGGGVGNRMPHTGDCGPLGVAGPKGGSEAGRDGSGGQCVVCLEAFREADLLLSLPCLHHFHEACIKVWLRQQGAAATCPLCKTPVFR